MTGKPRERRTFGRKIRDMKNDVNKLYTMNTRNHSVFGASITSGGGSSPSSQPTPSKITDIGLVSGTFEVDFNVYNSVTLSVTTNNALTLTFANIPAYFNLHLRIHIQSTNPVITIGGNIVSGSGSSPAITTASSDFLDVNIESTNQSTITILSTKKNDETSEDVAPGLPQNVASSEHTDTTIKITWDSPSTGSLPVTYDLLYSTSSAETGGVPDSPISDSSTLNLTTTSVTVNSLSAGTAYYFWVRAEHSSAGAGAYTGPLQTNTDGSYTAGDVGFTISATDFDTITAAWTQPGGKALKFTLLRDNEDGTGTFTRITDNDVPASTATTTVNDEKLEPNTEYTYKLEIRNEYGLLIATLTSDVTTAVIPQPTLVLSNTGGRLRFTVTLPVDFGLGRVAWSTSSSVDSTTGAFNGTYVVTRDISRTDGVGTGTYDIVYDTQVLTPSTTYYGMAQLRKNSAAGAWSAQGTTTTSTVSPPSKPTITVSSPDTGEVRIKLKFNDSTSTGETISVSTRAQSSVGEYTHYKTYERDNKPADDLDSRENRIEVITDGWTPGDSYTFRAECSNVSGTSAGGADTDNVTVDN
jgi:hypothetical protein